MASEKTLAIRELEQSLQPRHEMKTAGPTSLEALQTQGKVISTNRRTRLKAERVGLTRKQRNEIRELRKLRKFEGIEPTQPDWAQEPTADAQEPAEEPYPGGAIDLPDISAEVWAPGPFEAPPSEDKEQESDHGSR